MARPLRIEMPGGLYHVMSRGNERRAIVHDDADRRRRLDWLRRTVETHRWRLHAFVLMNNHEHLFVETPEPNLSAGMHLLNGSYTGYFNLRHRRVGHLFQGRFKAHLIEQEGHFLEISRYIHLNPVRARLVRRPERWPWSSYPGYRRARLVLPWVTYARVLGDFGNEPSLARRQYGHFVRAGLETPPKCPWAEAFGDLIVGSEAFVERVRRLLGDRPSDRDVLQLEQLRPRPSMERIIAVVAEQFGCPQSRWRPGSRNNDASRAVAAYLARRKYGYPATAVAGALGYRRHSSVGTAVRRIEASGEELKKTLAALERKLVNV